MREEASTSAKRSVTRLATDKTRATWFEAERLAIADVSTLHYCAKSGTAGGDVNREPGTRRRAIRIAAPPSPRINTGPLFPSPRRRLRHRAQPRHDPAPGL